MQATWLRFRAPFAAFRWMQAGVYRASSPVITPSAAWGLVLNLAHIETRLQKKGVTTAIDPEALPLCLAIGTVAEPERSVIYQQLHSYPVGGSGKELAPMAKGSKFWIAPVRREILIDLDVMIGVRTDNSEIHSRVRDGLAGKLNKPRYGLPFAGDNNLMFDRIDCLDVPVAARWYNRIGDDEGPSRGTCRLTVRIDREDSSRTESKLFAPTAEATQEPEESAWTWTPAPP